MTYFTHCVSAVSCQETHYSVTCIIITFFFFNFNFNIVFCNPKQKDELFDPQL